MHADECLILSTPTLYDVSLLSPHKSTTPQVLLFTEQNHQPPHMAKLILSLCFVLLFSGCLALRLQPQQNECQFNRLNALEPDNRIESEAGVIETWNPNKQQFLCAGVALSRCTLHRNGLLRPFYTNAPQQIFIQQGRGKFGMIFPGCPETFEEPREEEEEEIRGRERPQDRHQKVHNLKENDVIAVPAGVAFWMYNSEDAPVVAVSLIDSSSVHNQLDKMPRRFYLAGKQEQEFLQYQQHEKQRGGRHHGEQGQEESGNVFKGFSTEFLEQSFQVSGELVRRLKGQNEEEEEERGGIVRVRGGLSIISPPMRRRGHRPGKGFGNGLEETICTMRLRANIGKTTSPDIYNPRAGSITTLNSLDFPILSWLGLSAEFGFLHRNAMFVPHYNLNANSIIYPLRGRAHVQVVDCTGNTVFDDKLQEFQVLTVPQNFAVAAKALSQNFQYVAFKTNDRPTIATLAGGTSLFKAMPAEVLAQSLGIRTHQAMQLKFNNDFKFLVPPRQDSQSQMRAVA